MAGAAQFKNLPEVGKLRLPAAYVVPGDDSPGENKSQTDYWQELKEGFSVVVILSNGRDERGQFASYDVVDDVRQMLFKALLGWNPEACGNPITYDGGTLLDLNRHELIYQFDFSVISELTEDDTRQQDDLNSLDELRTLAIDVDYLDPGKYGRHKLASDGTRFGPGQAIVTPAVIKGELLATYRQLERAGIVENYELFKQYLVVERDASDPNRLNTLFPPDYVNQLRVFAVVNQFRLQYSEESA